MAGTRTYTLRTEAIRVLTRTGGGEFTASTTPLTVGRGAGSSSSITRRLQLRFDAPSWPSRGSLKSATLTVDEADGSSHPDWRGGSPRLWVKRRSDTDTVVGDPVEFNVRGRTSRDVSAMVRQTLPTRLGGAASTRFGLFELRSSDESNANRSMVLTARITLTVVIDVRVVPDEADILEVVGAQEDTSDPTLVASDDGQTLEVRFAFAAGPGETCAKAELELRAAGASDAVPGTLIRSSGNVAPIGDGGVGIYRARLTSVPAGSEGRWRLRPTSSSGKQGPWTSLDEDIAHVQLATIPGAPVDITVQPFVDDPTIGASLPSSHPGTISGMQARVTLLPQGRVWDSGMEDIGGSLRRATIVYGGEALGDGQQTSTVVRLRDQDGVIGRYSAPVIQTHRVAPTVTVSPAPSRLTTRTPTITLGFPLADGAKLELLHETDDDIFIYASGATPLTNQTSHGFVIPADTLAYGQRFRVRGDYVPDGGGTTYTGTWSTPVGPYSIAALPTSALSVPDAIGRKVPVEDVEWLRTITDPDGAALDAIEQEIRVADTPQGDGALVIRAYDPTAAALATIADGEVTYETSVDVRVRAYNDTDDLVSTTLSGAHTAGDSTPTLASETGVTVGMTLVFSSAVAGETESGEVASLGPLTLTAPLQFDHGNAQAVKGRAPGPWSPWTTWSALEPPDVDLLTPANAATVTRPWQAFDWSTTPHGGRTAASASLNLYDEDDQLLAAVAIDDATSIANAPAFLLEDATGYQWDVTVTDSAGMARTSARRSFTTAFVEPDALDGVTAAHGDGGIVVSWDTVTDPDLHHIEVSWQADDGTWVRIDGGPEELGDDSEPFTGDTLTHIGARLGVNAYSVRPHNGWRAAEPSNASATLAATDPTAGTWEAVTGAGSLLSLRVMDAPIMADAVLDAQQPPGGDNQAYSWGIGPRRISMRIDVAPAVDGTLAASLRSLMADPSRGRTATPVWIRPAAGWLHEPVWSVLASLAVTPGGGGRMQLSPEWLEVGPPVHAILPPAPEPLPEGTPDIYVDISEYDFGEIEIVDEA